MIDEWHFWLMVYVIGWLGVQVGTALLSPAGHRDDWDDAGVAMFVGFLWPFLLVIALLLLPYMLVMKVRR